jgi:adenine deaminase
MRELLAAARGDLPCDLVIRGGRVANVLSLEYEDADVGIKDGMIVGVGRGYRGLEEMDASGMVVAPGFIDGHIHIESTLLTPGHLAELVAPLGTTTIFPDPHEIANTCGASGVEFLWRDSLASPVDMFFGAPSCVPASPFETPREEIGAAETAAFTRRGWCGHLGEMMDFPGVIAGGDGPWGKIAAAEGLVKTGHAPGVSGRELCAYLMSGCDSDHECGGPEEALEKLRRGAWVMMREGAAERNLKQLAKIIADDEARYARCMAVSDDLTVEFVLSSGHQDNKIRVMIDAGIRPLVALAMVTINPADYFRRFDRGAIAPGRIADIVLLDSLESCRAKRVWKNGRLAASDGAPVFTTPPPDASMLPLMANKQQILRSLTSESLRIAATPGKKIRVIEASPGVVLTGERLETPRELGGFLEADPERDVMKAAVVEKNRGTGRVALGFVTGFGLKRGALASSVAHDAHNFIAIGADDESILSALRVLAENGGGLAVAEGSEVKAFLPLPIGGLMSPMSPADVAAESRNLDAAATGLGTSMPHPFSAMSFMSLSVIPELKLTDQGYIAAGVELKPVSLFA